MAWTWPSMSVMTDTAQAMLGLDQFAELHGVSTRTIRRWRDAGRIPAATKRGGEWLFPADATISQDDPTPRTTTQAVERRPLPPATLQEVLDGQPGFLPLDMAARFLGLEESVLMHHREYFQLEQFGPRNTPKGRRTWVMPKSRVRELDGH